MAATTSSLVAVAPGAVWTQIVTGKANAYLQVKSGEVKLAFGSAKPADGTDPGSFTLDHTKGLLKFEGLDASTNIYALARIGTSNVTVMAF